MMVVIDLADPATADPAINMSKLDKKTMRMSKARVNFRARETTEKFASAYDKPIQGRRSMRPKAS
jgi:hypothetical protein